jgi:hypothetical protein
VTIWDSQKESEDCWPNCIASCAVHGAKAPEIGAPLTAAEHAAISRGVDRRFAMTMLGIDGVGSDILAQMHESMDRKPGHRYDSELSPDKLLRTLRCARVC